MEIPQQLKQRGIKFVLLEKQGKKPFQMKWQMKVIEFDNPELLAHITSGGNYGVMGGGEKKLVIVDFDDEKTQEECMKKLPETFTVKTGRGMFHLYYFSNNDVSFKAFNESMDTLVDVQGDVKQCVGPGSIHPNGNPYEVIKDIPIAFVDYAELKATISIYDKNPKREEKPVKEYQKEKHLEDNFIDDVKRKVSIKDVLDWIGVDTSRNPTQCPFHDSSGGKCLGFKHEVCHCFHCDEGWNIFSLIMDYKKCNFKESLEIAAKLGNMESELEESRKRYIEKLRANDRQEYQQTKMSFLEIIADKDNRERWAEASELLVDFILKKMWIYTTKDDIKSEVWIYKDGIYVSQGKSEIKEFLRNLLGNFYSIYVYNLVMAKIEPDTFIDIDKFFKSSYPNEVPVLNGILNITTLQLSEYNPEKIFFNKMPVLFDPSKKCTKIDNFLSEVLANEEDKKVFYELIGSALLDEYKYEKAFMLHGAGRNGKSKTIELLKRLFGMENCCSIQLSSLDPESFSISELFGKRLNLAGDIGSQDLKETNMFRSLTGRDFISAKRKFLRNLHFTNSANFVFACNTLPMVYDLSKGFWERWVLLDYPYTFVRKDEYDTAEDKKNLKVRDEDILNKITSPDEMSGLLNEGILGLKRLSDNKGFSTTQGSEQVKQTWIRRSNSFIAFCFDMIVDEYDGRISKKALRKKYAEYCRTHKVSPKSDFVVKKVLQENFGASEVTGQTEFGVRNDFWEGIRWKD